MSIARLDLPGREDVTFFTEETSAYFLPHIRCVAELKQADLTPMDCGSAGYSFRVYFSYRQDIELGFYNRQTALKARSDLIFKMMDYWGPDQVVFSNGFDYDVTVVCAIQEVTEVIEKDHHSGFALVVADVPCPICLVFPELELAIDSHDSLIRRIERHRQQMAMQKMAVNT
jgi:hypothetical protein